MNKINIADKYLISYLLFDEDGDVDIYDSELNIATTSFDITIPCINKLFEKARNYITKNPPDYPNTENLLVGISLPFRQGYAYATSYYIFKDVIDKITSKKDLDLVTKWMKDNSNDLYELLLLNELQK